jgi:translation initiation factor IF-1
VAVAVAFMPAAARASTPRPAVALTASPAHVTLVGAGRQTIHVANLGTAAVVVDITRAGFSLGPRGRPRALLRGVAARHVASWLAIRPRRIVLPPGGVAPVTVASLPPAAAAPGDHTALVLLTTQPLPGAAVAVRMRIGVTVVTRVHGRIEHGLRLRSLRVRRSGRRSVIQVVLANTGNVVEWLHRGRVQVSLLSGGHVVARLRSAPRELLPGTSGILELPYRGAVRGPLAARVVIAASGGRAQASSRSFRVRL